MPAGKRHVGTPGNDTRMGVSVTRREDARLLTGSGCFIADRRLPDEARAVIVRSPHASAAIVDIDCDRARCMPGVIAICTARDLDADRVGGLPWLVPPPVRESGGLRAPEYLPLCRDRVRYVGDAVALVVADSLDQAVDAAEQVHVEYAPSPVVTDPLAAKGGAEQCFRLEQGDAEHVAGVLRDAPRRTSVRLVNNRVVPMPLESRGAIGTYDTGADEFTLYTGTQTPHLTQSCLANDVLGVPASKLRVIVDDVGGAFGAKAPIYREQALVLWAARRLGRPVKWIADRTESFLCDTQGRDTVTDASLALDEDGRILAADFAIVANLGAYLSYYGAVPPSTGIVALAGVYDIPAIHLTVDAVFTHTVMNDAYRGAGRPEAIFALERLLDTAACDHGFAPVALRRRNFVPADRIPFRTALGTTYDSGNFGAALERALTLADWNGFEARREASRRCGRLRGIGLASYIERAGGGLDDAATVEIDADGHATLYLGTMASGQGHDTAYAQVACHALGLEWEEVSVVQGDTGRVPSGRGSFGSRSLPVGGSALWLALQEVLRQARDVASGVLEVNEIDMAFAEGWFHVPGTDRRVHLREVAKAVHQSPRRRQGGRPALSAEERFQPRDPTFPNGCHVCEVEIDPETGEVTLRAYTAVDDFGNEVNPTIVDGQVHGGIAQGVGQALMEQTRYDPATGQLFSGTLLDYRLPRADDLTPFVLARESTACRNNPLGVKGCGEAGAIAAPPAVMNAMMNALSEFGISNLDMPATPVQVWNAIRAARDRK